MSSLPTKDELTRALAAAGNAHHEYETNALQGQRDEQWAAWYAAYVLGRLGGFASPSHLAKWLAAAPSDDDWASAAAAYVLRQAELPRTDGHGG